jgi:oligopeptide transport system ATP-binding protein
MTGEPILEVRDLVKHFEVGGGLFGGPPGLVKAVDGVSFAIRRGETLGLVGESGCGKTTTGRCILQLERPTSGQVIFEGVDLTALGQVELRAVRRRVQVIFQDPYSSLNPRMTVGQIIAEPLGVHGIVPERRAREARMRSLLDRAGLLPAMADRYPHELSGGQRQRIAIARALAVSPKLIVLDEPVSALDVSIRAQILNLLRDLQQQLGVSYLFIAHDLAAVAHMSHTIAVMYLGKIVEIGPAAAVARMPKHPYTQALFAAALPSHPDEARDDMVLPGEVPSPLAPPSGCRFHPRCPSVMARCATDEPALRRHADRRVACHLYDGPPAA